ncbi:hypothetical protein NPX79_02960 [Spiroplasma endosymbiont of Anurida maritima]|uniref:hypothetical protein n=1 Tax=Spiroplasma endosymbiont of Anurida maritima TaxID=2967972 RepID=UPI0036D25FF0
MTILNQSLLYVAIVLAGIFTCYLLVYKIFLFNKKSKKQEKKQLAEIINKKHLILSDSQKMEISLESKNGKELILVIKDVFYDYKTNKDNYFSLNKSDDKYDVINFSFHQKSIKNKNVGNYKNIIIDLMNAINKFEYLNTTIILEGLSSFVYEFIKEKDKYNFIFVNPVSKRKYLKFSKPAQISYFLGVILNHNKPLHLKFDSSIFSKKNKYKFRICKISFKWI